MMKISAIAKKFILISGGLAAVLIASSAVYYRSLSCLPFVFGVLLGTAVAMLKVVLLERTVDRALTMEKKAAGNYTRLHHVLRLLLTGAALVLAALVPKISLWGAAAGVLTFQAAAHIHRFFLKK